jgi:hypothetical protein
MEVASPAEREFNHEIGLAEIELREFLENVAPKVRELVVAGRESS